MLVLGGQVLVLGIVEQLLSGVWCEHHQSRHHFHPFLVLENRLSERPCQIFEKV